MEMFWDPLHKRLVLLAVKTMRNARRRDLGCSVGRYVYKI